MMDKEYVAPELQLAGEADQVILGLGSAGGDFFGEWQIDDGGFALDEN